MVPAGEISPTRTEFNEGGLCRPVNGYYVVRFSCPVVAGVCPCLHQAGALFQVFISVIRGFNFIALDMCQLSFNCIRLKQPLLFLILQAMQVGMNTDRNP